MEVLLGAHVGNVQSDRIRSLVAWVRVIVCEDDTVGVSCG